MRATADLESK